MINNTVAGVFATATNTHVYGIEVLGSGSEARGNRVRGLVVAGTGAAVGISSYYSGVTFADNRISAASATAGYGIRASGANTFCTGNTVVNFSTAYESCDASADNLTLP